MIDFNNKSLIKLSPYSNEKANNLIEEIDKMLEKKGKTL